MPDSGDPSAEQALLRAVEALGLWSADALRDAHAIALRDTHTVALRALIAELMARGHQELLERFVSQHRSQDAAARTVTALNEALAPGIVGEGLQPAVALWCRDEEALAGLWPLSDWSELQLGMPCSRRFVRHSYSDKPVFRQSGRATCGRDGRYLALITACLRERLGADDVPPHLLVIAFFDIISVIMAAIQVLQEESISRTGHYKSAPDTEPPAPEPEPGESGALLVFPPQAEHTSALRQEWTESTQRLIGLLVSAEEAEEVSLDRSAVQAQRVLLLLGMVVVEQLSGERSPTFDADLLFQRDFLGAEEIASGSTPRPLVEQLLRLQRRCLTEQAPDGLRLRLRLMTLLDVLAQRLSARSEPLTFADVLHEIEALRPGRRASQHR